MKQEHILDELSAYLDGESDDAENIQRHLQHCPECARHCLELRKVSAALQGTPLPEVSPALSATILARTEKTASPRITPFFRPAVFAALAATALIVVGAALWLGPPQAPVLRAAQAPDEAALLEDLGRLVDDDTELTLFADFSESPIVEDESSIEEIFSALACSLPEAEVEAPEEPWPNEETAFLDVDHLNPEEDACLALLLQDL
jgi:hypothetical protein